LGLIIPGVFRESGVALEKTQTMRDTRGVGKTESDTPFMTDPERLRHFMREAIAEGKKALPECRPNPPVGCVLVRRDVIVARGYTQPPYQPHAEPAALRHLEGDLPDVMAFVTLEPCAFHQKTPSCAMEMIARRVGYVYVALMDTHPRNQGRGIQMLRDAGIPVVTDFLSDEARPHLAPYLYGPDGSEPPVGW
jgi:pyrimidine deaminase RibD-like protein